MPEVSLHVMVWNKSYLPPRAARWPALLQPLCVRRSGALTALTVHSMSYAFARPCVSSCRHEFARTVLHVSTPSIVGLRKRAVQIKTRSGACRVEPVQLAFPSPRGSAAPADDPYTNVPSSELAAPDVVLRGRGVAETPSLSPGTSPFPSGRASALVADDS